jgi:hypothetical protein
VDNIFKELAEYNLNLARRAATAGNAPGARKAYCASIGAWKRAIEIHPSLQNYLLDTEKEYMRFVKSDRISPKILEAIKKVVQENPGIREEALYLHLDEFHRTDVENVLFLALRNKDIERRWMGQRVELRLPDNTGSGVFSSIAGAVCGTFIRRGRIREKSLDTVRPS